MLFQLNCFIILFLLVFVFAQIFFISNFLFFEKKAKTDNLKKNQKNRKNYGFFLEIDTNFSGWIVMLMWSAGRNGTSNVLVLNIEKRWKLNACFRQFSIVARLCSVSRSDGEFLIRSKRTKASGKAIHELGISIVTELNNKHKTGDRADHPHHPHTFKLTHTCSPHAQQRNGIQRKFYSKNVVTYFSVKQFVCCLYFFWCAFTNRLGF